MTMFSNGQRELRTWPWQQDLAGHLDPEPTAPAWDQPQRLPVRGKRPTSHVDQTLGVRGRPAHPPRAAVHPARPGPGRLPRRRPHPAGPATAAPSPPARGLSQGVRAAPCAGHVRDRTTGRPSPLRGGPASLAYCPRSSLPAKVLTWLAGRLAHLVPPRQPGRGGTRPLSLEVRLDAVAAVVLDGLSYRRAGRMVGSPRPRSATASTCCWARWPHSATASPTGPLSPPSPTCANTLRR